MMVVRATRHRAAAPRVMVTLGHGAWSPIRAAWWHVNDWFYCHSQESCLDSWTSADDVVHATRRRGCPSPACDGGDPWCLASNPGCADSESGEWFCARTSSFSTAAPSRPVPPAWPASPPSPCVCLDSWTSDDGGTCDQTQSGCSTCDGDTAPWCMVANPGCIGSDGDDWFYCHSQEQCECLSSWTSDDGGTCDQTQSGCSTCDGDTVPWCRVLIRAASVATATGSTVTKSSSAWTRGPLMMVVRATRHRAAAPR